MNELHELPIRDVHQLLVTGEISAEELLRHYLDRIDQKNSELGALVFLDREGPLNRATAIEGSFDTIASGIPTADKDLVRRAGMPTGYGSRVRNSGELETVSDPMALWVDDVGAISLGKTATSEFGMAGYTEPAVSGPVRNPHNPSRQVGGSSGGAAAAVAAGLLPFAPGSDGGGSIRIPALACGVVGWKPSRGLIPSSSGLESPGGLAVAGLITKSVGDLADLAPELIRGEWHWSTRAPNTGFSEPLRIGVTTTSPWPGGWGIRPGHDARDALERAAGVCGDLGEVGPVAWQPDPDYHAHFFAVWALSAARIEIDDESNLEPLTAYLREAGRGMSANDYGRALSRLREFETDTIRAFSEYDVVITPGLATPPPEIGFFSDDPEENFRQQVEFTPWTSFVNVAGLPAIALPVAMSQEGMPVGVQLIGRPGSDLDLIDFAGRLGARVPGVSLPFG